MKKVMMILGIATLLASCNQKGVNKNAKLSAGIDSVSFSLGVLMGSDLGQMPIADSLKQELIFSGIAASLAKEGKSQISKEDAMRIWREFMKKEQERQMKEAQEKMAKTKEEGKKFLEANKAKAGVITTESGLQYQIKKQGEGKVAKEGEIAVVNYTGTLIDGTEFDSSLKEGRKPFEVAVGEGHVIRGWDEALKMMPVGSKWKLFIPAELAYGNRAMGKDIPAGSTLIFDVELLELKPAPKKK